MKWILEPIMQEWLLAEKRFALPAAALNQLLAPPTGFPQPQTKVTLISVDTAGREVLSPSQKGF
jgi:hypothetical protein